jgi:hypothetical protein
MGLHVRARKVAGNDRLATYSFTTGDGPERMLVVDLDSGRIWPEDGNEDGVFRGAVLAIVRERRRRGTLPDRASHQS